MVFYSGFGETIEFIVRDSSGAKLDFCKCNLNDEELAKRFMRLLKSKYNFDIWSKKKAEDRDIDWLDKTDW